MENFNREKLRKAREARGMSQELLAERVDASVRYIRALEQGEKSNPSAKMMFRISNALGTPMEDFLKEEKNAED